MAHMLYKLVKPQTAAADINNNDDDEEEGGSHNRIIRRRKRPNPFDMLKWSRHKIYRFLTYIFAAASYISHLINVILDYKSVAEREGMSLDDATEFWNTYYLFPSTIFSIIYNISFDCGK